MAQDFFDEVKDHAKKQGLDHMGVSLIERHSVSFTTRFWNTWTWVILLGVRVFLPSELRCASFVLALISQMILVFVTVSPHATGEIFGNND